ncbi:TPA: lytic transglycosylase domain-containing protein [Escherichia coli]|uniref:lytic transglycosylase domain-containing protein n=1 Tax=Enterobacteriaceae TaxID=543 RepID=UPI0004D8380D|nr:MULTISPECIES: lytic transglycosylase domain-containing protein [Enterobacteriaceae]EFP7514514.1 lytic transglycosylase domain-containing protein [Shigella flexneri]EED1203411.1 lytic transglycosylase domain-containing protein [Escherichia coli]EEV9396612.1 lytic transglycosylase domain-containing protein [Escherichia coli]EFV8483205.1 transglycosylase SLT domain-containing protein [Shigella flexneri]EGZ5520872.1 lytic transglycosylase domain-containing protein [Escherichia coli]
MTLISQCAPGVSPETMRAIIMTESGGNPYAIANVTDGGSKYFTTEEEAVNHAKKLTTDKKNFSAGLGQINSRNFQTLNLTHESVFSPCANIRAAAAVLKTCWDKYDTKGGGQQKILRDAISCYYSGNNKRGYVKESNGKSYIDIIEEKAGIHTHYDIPAIKSHSETSSHLMVSSDNHDKWDVFGDFGIQDFKE